MEQARLDGTWSSDSAVGEEESDGTVRTFVEVAVPIPVPGGLTYEVPDALSALVVPGCRVKADVGRRRLVGVAMAVHQEPPQDFKPKALAEVLDIEPVLSTEMLDLARFVADYYMAPLGETVRLMVPADLPPFGDRRVTLTDGGALAPPRDEHDAALVQYLIEHPRSRVAELQKTLRLPDLPSRLQELRELGRVAVEEPGRRGSGYVKAVEIAPGDLADHLEAAGRSAQGRAVLQMLAELGRPATLKELTEAVGCGPAVIRRLGKLGLLREFTQPERLSLKRHRLDHDPAPGFELRPDQKTALDGMEEGLRAAEYRPFLLHGMTGSGKTEVYLRAASTCLGLDRCAIFMVPEIALVPALAGEARRRFGDQLAVLHSGLSSAERRQEWERIRRGEARVILGPRSALWAPVERLGLIVIDEEHDASYKQDKAPRYNGRDLALLRARNHGAVAVAVSATPSMESRHNVEIERLGLLTLTRRAGVGQLPETVLVDLKAEGVKAGEAHFSGPLRQEIRAALDRDEQVILMRNRRGYAPVLLCRSCGEDYRCEDCGLPMTYHRRGHTLSCHYCSHELPAPRRCTTCDEPALEPMGAGTERVEERFKEIFPGTSVDVLDADVGRRAGGAAAVLERFSQGKTQVLIGTQMVAKGHHFPRVSLAAVLFADTYLKFPDFRAVERTYALLTQLAGRAGRGERQGRVVIQTYQPDHYAIRAAMRHDDAGFAEEEMRFRRIFSYPPYARVIKILSQEARRPHAEAVLIRLTQLLREQDDFVGIRLVGPSPAPLERLRGKWRFQCLLRGPSGSRMRRCLRRALEQLNATERSLLLVDVDPQDLM